MKCFKPIKLRLTKEQINKRINMQNLPDELRFATYTYVPCGKCEACLSNRRTSWTIRLMNEVKHCDSCYFVTLTYDDEHLNYEAVNVDGALDYVPMVCKRDCQLFLKRFRKLIQPFKIRYFLVSEYGPQTLRPHYHMLLFNFPHLLKHKLDEFLSDSWKLGFIRVDPINPARVNYVTSYCLDSSTLPGYLVKNFMLCSKRPAIGFAYLDESNMRSYHVDNAVDFCFVETSGQGFAKVKLPRYYRDKIFSDDEKFAFASENVKRIYEENVRLYDEQRRWLEREGYDVNYISLHSPFRGSPLYVYFGERNDIKKRVRRKNKMNKKKL